MRKLLALLAIPLATACEQVATSCPPVPTQHVITIGEDYRYRFDAQPGDRLDLVMTPDGGQLDRCNHAGGELTFDVDRDLWTCEGVDF